MILCFVILTLLTAAEVIGNDRRSRNYDKSIETYISRKGGLSKKVKYLNAPFIMGKVYIAPQLRNRIRIISTFDLQSYTICERQHKELFANMSSILYRYTVCPDEDPGVLGVIAVKEYCCPGIFTRCCNATEFMSTIDIRQGGSFNFRALFSVVGLCIFVAIFATAIKVMCGSRIRNRWSLVTVFNRQGPPPNSGTYQPAMPLMYQPNNQGAEPKYSQQYNVNTYNNPSMSPNINGQYPQGPYVMAQYPYGQAPPPGPYPYAPPPSAGQYNSAPPPDMTQQFQNPYPTQIPSHPPPEYQRAIIQ